MSTALVAVSFFFLSFFLSAIFIGSILIVLVKSNVIRKIGLWTNTFDHAKTDPTGVSGMFTGSTAFEAT